MTEQEKDILIGKMLDSPSSLTDEELDMILTDDELKEIYEISSALKGASMDLQDMDVEREWRLFRQRILPEQSPMRWMMKVAAIFLGVVLACGILVKFTYDILTDDDNPIVADAGESVDINKHVGDNYVDNHPTTENEIISEAPVSVENFMVSKPATDKKLITPAAKKEVEDEIDVEEILRQQQKEIDHEIAMLNAEIYLDEQDAMREFMEYMNCNDIHEADANIIIQ